MSQTAIAIPPAGRRERFAWAMYDFANSGYTTVVLTTVFNAYFVAVIAGHLGSGAATLLWTGAIAVGNVIVLSSAPVIGAIGDHRASKKPFLVAATLVCVIATALLAAVAPGEVAIGIVLIVVSYAAFTSAENLIAAFLTEIVPAERIGRMSGYGWGLGYFGGLATLAICLGYIDFAQARGHGEAQFVPVTLVITAVIYGTAAIPTFLWLRERAIAQPPDPLRSHVRVGFARVRQTLRDASRFRDLFRFLLALVIFQSGVNTVVVLAAVYAREVVGFATEELVLLVMVINVTAGLAAFAVGHFQDRFGSLSALRVSLVLWIVAIVLVLFAEDARDIWVAGHLVGVAMGASQSGGRALIGQFTPVARTGEFFGLWGFATRVATIVGPMSFGTLSFVTGGNQRIALVSTLTFFVAGLVALGRIDEARGKATAASEP